MALGEPDHDTDSLSGDPLFLDWEKADFRPRPDSPIHRMDITRIDLSNVGLTRFLSLTKGNRAGRRMPSSVNTQDKELSP
jgi:hypothetical protein